MTQSRALSATPATAPCHQRAPSRRRDQGDRERGGDREAQPLEGHRVEHQEHEPGALAEEGRALRPARLGVGPDDKEEPEKTERYRDELGECRRSERIAEAALVLPGGKPVPERERRDDDARDPIAHLMTPISFEICVMVST